MGNELKRVNFDVQEMWFMECPECGLEQPAPFNEMNPMQPMEVVCENRMCLEKFILTYERD